MFKFPLKRHHNNTNRHHHTKSASTRSNEGFIYIRCGHANNNNNNNNSNSNNNNNNNNINHINNNNTNENNNSNNNINNTHTTNNDCKSNSNCNIPDIPPAYHGYNENVAKSTVQSSWRPQLPLPKEVHLSNENINHHPQHNFNHHNSYQPEDDVDIDEIQIIESDMERFHLSKKDASLNGSQISNASHNGSTSNKKWSFGRLFRRKKEVESQSSSEEDRKAGFLPLQKHSRSANSSASVAITTSTPNKKNKSSKSSASSRGSKLMSENVDHVIVPPTAVKGSRNHVDNEFFLPLETVPAPEPYYQNKPVQQTQQRLHHSQQYLPHVPQTQQQLMSRSFHSLDRKTAKAKQRSLQKMSQNGLPSTTIIGSSSEEEIISLNSTTFAKYRSDESIHSGGQSHVSGQSRRSRAARNERYYKRLSRDGEVSHGQVPVMYAQQPTQRWKTQPVPLSIYQAPKQQVVASQQPQPQPQSQMRASASQNSQYSKLRNTNSLQHMAPYVQWGQMQQQQQSKNLQNSVNDTKRSISYDSHIHLQNANGRLQNKPMPPPPPPRDPLRRVNVSGHMQEDGSGDLRPMSYAFDQTGVPVLPTTGLNGRCVSDDKIWAQQPHYQSIHSLNITPNQTSQSNTAQPNRRFITRAERDAQPGKKSLPNGLEFHYVADATPRSRKPIHLLEPNTFENDPPEPPSSGVLRTTKSGLPTSPTKVNATEFWKRLEGSSQNVNTPTPAPRGRDAQRANAGDKVVMKPRSVSSSRVGEMRAYPVPMYSEVYKPKNKTNTTSTPPKGGDEVDGVICGSLHIKPAQDKSTSYVEIRNKDENKSKSMPNNYQRRSGELPTTPNKYEEYVNERREQHLNPLFDLPQPPQRKLSGVPQIPQLSFPRKKPANLEEAINELEAIYRSLGLTEEPETKKERVPTPNDFEKYAVAHADEYEDEDSPTGEPDPVRDDVAFRNIKLANLQHKTVEKQPPFGIPVGPIVPAAQTDYLHVTPKRKDSGMYELKSPDVVKDDLAVRALRKELGESRTKFQYPSGSLLKKNRATRTQSANIYALIQRDAAKPSGGDLHSYLELTKNIDRSGSMSDLHKHDSASDIPTTLKLLQNLREQEREQNQNQNQLKKVHIPFRHPSQGGAICQLPEKLISASHEEEKRSKPVPMPRKSMTPEPRNTDTHKMEEALNKIAQDAQESSIKLTQELKELRKEALITASRPRKVSNEEEKLEKELQEIEKVSQAAKQCGQLLLDTLPDVSMEEGETNVKKRKLHKEDKLIKAIDQVSEAANKVCEKILKDIVTTEPPVVVQEAVKITQMPLAGSETKDDNLVMPTLIKKLDPIQSTNIEAIARRCMRQLSDLGDNHDYDNLNQPDIAVASTCNIQQVTKDEITNDLNTSNLTETRKPPNKPMAKKNQHSKQIEEIDQIMKECEDQAKQSQIAKNAVKGNPVVVTQHVIKAPGSSTTTASSFSSSSDCLAKSSSPSGSRPFSSSITSFNPYSSSDYIKSPSSEFHAPSTDPIKTFSTTSYDVQSTASATPNLTTISTFSYSPSPPPLNLTPVSNCSATIASYTQRGRSSSPSQYNSSEELAMIFGIEEKTKTRKQPNNNSGKDDATPELRLELEQEKLKTNAASLPQCTANATTTTTTTTATTTDPCECCCAKTNDYPLFLTPNSCSQTNTASSSPISSLASSSSLLRLEAIPESSITGNAKTILVKATEKSEAISPHFNRVYASKFRIIVDKMKEDTTHTLIQYNSLSSLEESSSNPDSGNVSLADFPLGQHNINNSIQLNPNFNSRYEIRNCFKTEISIDTEQEEEKEEKEEENKVKKPEQKIDKEFPRLPTAEELANSLKEHCSLEQSFKKTAEFLGEQNSLKEKLALTKEDRELIGERIIWARDEIMAEVKALENKALKEKHQQEILERKEREKHSNGDEFLKDVSDGAKEVPKRKRSIVIETPLLEMNIMEEKINYEFNVSGKDPTNAAEEALQLQELAQNCESLKQALNEEIDKECHAKKEAYEHLNQALNMNIQNKTQNEGNKELGSSEVTQKCQALNRTLNEDNQKEIDNEFSCLNLAQNCPDIQALNENLQIEIQEEMVNKMKTNIDDDHDFSLALNKSFQNDNHNKRETKDHIEVVNEIVSHEVAHDLNQALNDRNQEDKQNMNKNNETNEEIHCLENLNQALNADRVQEDKQNCQDLSQSLNQENRTENHKLEDLNQALNTDLHNETNDYRLRVWQPSSLSHSDDMPSTSSKALANSTTNMVVNVMGEQRPAVNSLTLLEHLVVACTLGVISTDDLFTLCLIIIGIIIVIAIALF